MVKKNQLNEFLIYFYKIIQNNKYLLCDKNDIIYIIAGDLNLDFDSQIYQSFMDQEYAECKNQTRQLIRRCKEILESLDDEI